MRQRDQHLHRPASVVEADPAKIGQTALGELVMVHAATSVSGKHQHEDISADVSDYVNGSADSQTDSQLRGTSVNGANGDVSDYPDDCTDCPNLIRSMAKRCSYDNGEEC